MSQGRLAKSADRPNASAAKPMTKASSTGVKKELQVWRDTLDILKKIQAQQAQKTVGIDIDPKALKQLFAKIEVAINDPDTEARQAKLLAGALQVFQKVFKAQVSGVLKAPEKVCGGKKEKSATNVQTSATKEQTSVLKERTPAPKLAKKKLSPLGIPAQLTPASEKQPTKEEKPARKKTEVEVTKKTTEKKPVRKTQENAGSAEESAASISQSNSRVQRVMPTPSKSKENLKGIGRDRWLSSGNFKPAFPAQNPTTAFGRIPFNGKKEKNDVDDAELDIVQIKGWKSSKNIQHVNSSKLSLTPINAPQPPVPNVQYGLDRVLFNPGVYVLQDPRSKVWNFDPYLGSIMPVKEFDFNALKQYITSSKDTTLIDMALKHKKKFAGSTSSMTAMLSHFHYLLSAWRPVNPANMSKHFEPESLNFTRIMRAPAATFLNWKDGTYAIDADKEYDSASILSMLGKSMEKFLTLPKEEFEKYRLGNSHQLTDEQKNGAEAYHYTTFGDLMMRSQLDAHDSRLPGTGMYDLKTRSVISIRMDSKNFKNGLGYEIRRRIGKWESFEREYFDMIRSAFLKYSLQVRMGRMDGIMVAFHNIERIFGVQYISIEEMDMAIHGTDNRTLGDREFMISLQLLNEVMEKASAKFPQKSLRLHVEARESRAAPFLYVFAEPVEAEDIEKVQSANSAKIDAFERDMLGIRSKDRNAPSQLQPAGEENEVDDDGVVTKSEDAQNDNEALEAVTLDESEDVWNNMRDVIEETMENDALGITAIRESIEDALEQSGFLQGKSAEESRHYVDALLESITEADVEAAESEVEPAADEAAAEAKSINVEESNVVEESTSDAEEVESPASAEEAATIDEQTSEFVQETEPQDAETRQLDNSEIQVAEASEESLDTASREALEEAAEHVSEAQAAAESTALSDTLSLKDLIVKMTSRVGSSSTQASQADAAGEKELTADEIKIRRFESILSELINGSKNASPSKADRKGPQDEEGSVFGMILTIRNRVNGEYVDRPQPLLKRHHWKVEYSIDEIPSKRVHNLYRRCKARRTEVLGKLDEDKEDYADMFQGLLEKYSQMGRDFRAQETRQAKKRPVWVYGKDEPMTYADVFGEDPEISDLQNRWVKNIDVDMYAQQVETEDGFLDEDMVEDEDAQSSFGEEVVDEVVSKDIVHEEIVDEEAVDSEVIDEAVVDAEVIDSEEAVDEEVVNSQEYIDEEVTDAEVIDNKGLGGEVVEEQDGGKNTV